MISYTPTGASCQYFDLLLWVQLGAVSLSPPLAHPWSSDFIHGDLCMGTARVCGAGISNKEKQDRLSWKIDNGRTLRERLV